MIRGVPHPQGKCETIKVQQKWGQKLSFALKINAKAAASGGFNYFPLLPVTTVSKAKELKTTRKEEKIAT